MRAIWKTIIQTHALINRKPKTYNYILDVIGHDLGIRRSFRQGLGNTDSLRLVCGQVRRMSIRGKALVQKSGERRAGGLEEIEIIRVDFGLSKRSDIELSQVRAVRTHDKIPHRYRSGKSNWNGDSKRGSIVG